MRTRIPTESRFAWISGGRGGVVGARWEREGLVVERDGEGEEK